MPKKKLTEIYYNPHITEWLLREQGNANNSFPQIGIESTTVVFTVRRVAAAPRHPLDSNIT